MLASFLVRTRFLDWHPTPRMMHRKPVAEPAPVTEKLDRAFESVDFGECRITFVLGHPRSDLGKGELIARLAAVTPGSSTIVKFDGILNTNERGNHPSPHDDLATYRRFHPHVVMGWPNQILGGDVLLSFLRAYGGTDWEHLSFVPHVSRHFLLELHRAWSAAGASSSLFVELGGTTFDQELTTYVLPAVGMLRTLHPHVRCVLLTELDGTLETPKTRAVQECISGSHRHGVVYDLVFLRIAASHVHEDVLRAVEDYVRTKVWRNVVHQKPAQVVAVPEFQPPLLDGYLEYLRQRLMGVGHAGGGSVQCAI